MIKDFMFDFRSLRQSDNYLKIETAPSSVVPTVDSWRRSMVISSIFERVTVQTPNEPTVSSVGATALN